MSFVRIGDHLKKMSELYGQLETLPGKGGRNINKDLIPHTLAENEILSQRQSLRDDISFLQRPRPIRVAAGNPKPGWAHVYYISFHDPQNSSGPTEGYYPVFLLSVDQKSCWLSVMLAAKSAGVSSTGWSQSRGARLRENAKLLGRNLPDRDGWIKGPITLGPKRKLPVQGKWL